MNDLSRFIKWNVHEIVDIKNWLNALEHYNRPRVWVQITFWITIFFTATYFITLLPQHRTSALIALTLTILLHFYKTWVQGDWRKDYLKPPSTPG